MDFEEEINKFAKKAVSDFEIAVKSGKDPWMYGQMTEVMKASAFAAILEKVKSTIGTDGTKTFEEENNRRIQNKEHPFIFRYEDGALGATDFIPMKVRAVRKQIRDEDIIELYFENLSPKEISKKLNRPLKRINKGLKNFGIHPENPHKKRFHKSDIPYGWTELNGKLVPDDSEQWVLQKISEEIKNGKKPEQIVTFLQKLGIKPRGGIWYDQRVSQVVHLNIRLRKAWGKNQSGWKELAEQETSGTSSKSHQ